MAEPPEIKDVLRAAMKRKAITQAELARQSGVTRQTVNEWLKGPTAPSRKRAPRVAKILDLPLSALTGNPMHANVVNLDNKGHSGRRVPVIDWVNAGHGAEVVSSQAIRNAYEYVEIHSAVSDAAFGLRVQGDSMEPKFSNGAVIVVDPNKKPRNGDYVVVELLPDGTPEGSGDVTFKRFRLRGVEGDTVSFDLQPCNPSYPTITINAGNPGRIIGTVVEHHEILVP